MKIDNDEIYREWRKWVESSPVVEKRQPSERFGELMLLIAKNLLLSPKFANYGLEDKEDMVGEAVLKMLRNLKNVREDRRNSLFSYFTLCANCAYLTYLKKKYKRMEVMAEYRQYLAQNFD